MWVRGARTPDEAAVVDLARTFERSEGDASNVKVSVHEHVLPSGLAFGGGALGALSLLLVLFTLVCQDSARGARSPFALQPAHVERVGEGVL